MEILGWGSAVQPKTWQLQEVAPCGFLRIYQILSGNVTYTDGYGTQKLHVGQCYILPSQLAYRITHDPRMPIRMVWVEVQSQTYYAQKLICVDTTQRTMQYHLFACLRQLCEQTEVADIMHCVSLILAQLAQRGQCGYVSPAFRPVVQQLYAAATTDLQMHTFAQQHGYSPEHFNRRFKKETGQTPYQFVLQRKMQVARMLLCEDMPISKVCAAVGYTDLKNFDRAFKTRHGITASAYRQAHKGI